MFKKYDEQCDLVRFDCSLGNYRFSPSTDIAGQTILKSSVQRTIRANLLAQWAIDQELLESTIWPKKESLVLVKGYLVY